jgi:hypothetical protein
MNVVFVFKSGHHLEKKIFLILLSSAESLHCKKRLVASRQGTGKPMTFLQCRESPAMCCKHGLPYIRAVVHNFSGKSIKSMGDFSSSL